MSDKRSHRKEGEGRSYLAVSESRSYGSSEPPFEGAEVWTWLSGARIHSITGKKTRRSFQDWVNRQETRRSFGFGRLHCKTGKEFTPELFFSLRPFARKAEEWNGKTLRPGKYTGILNGQPEGFTLKSKAGTLRVENHRKVKDQPARITVAWHDRKLRFSKVNGSYSSRIVPICVL